MVRKLAILLFAFSGHFHLALAQDGAGDSDHQTPPSEETPKRRTQNRRLQAMRPNWGTEITSTLNAFGQHPLLTSQGTNPAYGFSLHTDFQPAILQDIGILGIGPSLAVYPFFGAGNTNTLFSVWSVGGQIRYQARYFQNQILVPVAAYHLEFLRYSFIGGPSDSALMAGPSFGLWLFLNLFEPSAASEFFISNGVIRSYAVFEVRNFTSNPPGLASISGYSYYFGLRFEY